MATTPCSYILFGQVRARILDFQSRRLALIVVQDHSVTAGNVGQKLQAASYAFVHWLDLVEASS